MSDDDGAARTLTVVLVVWDAYAGRLLEEALFSIETQRPRPAILLIDNASTVPVVAPDGVRVIRSPERLTVGAVRNLGLSHVTTPWAMLWDADDVMLPGTVADLLAHTDAPDVVVVATGILDGTTGVRHHWPRRWTAVLTRLPRLYAMLHAVSSLYPTTGALLRTDTVLQGGGFADADGGDDWVVGVSLALRGRVVLRSRLGRVYRRHRHSVSADWTGGDDILAHAALVRQRLEDDPAAPGFTAPARCALWLAQLLVVRVLRPTSRRLPHRRHERHDLPELPRPVRHPEDGSPKSGTSDPVTRLGTPG
jgi:hypothetical protein